MEDKPRRSFYRAAKHYPPTDRAYRTPQDKGKAPPPTLTEEQRRSWDALSAWDSEEGARRAARQAAARGNELGRLIVRYDVPEEGSGITWEPSIEEGHYDLRGELTALKRYLSDFVADV